MTIQIAIRPPVSVCLASYNGARYIEAQIQSVLTQLQAHDELIISDDGSQDDTVMRVRQLADSRIRIFQNRTPLGVIHNFENAMAQASHDFIFLCDQDDVWLPGKVDRCVNALHQSIMVITNCRVVNAQLETLHASFYTLRSSRGMLANLWKNSYLGCCMAFRRSVLQHALPMPKNLPMHDMWLGLVAETCGPVVFLPEVLSLYRRHTDAISAAAGVSQATRLQQLKLRARLVFALVRRRVFKQ